jgi:hypothetical protein
LHRVPDRQHTGVHLCREVQQPGLHRALAHGGRQLLPAVAGVERGRDMTGVPAGHRGGIDVGERIDRHLASLASEHHR